MRHLKELQDYFEQGSINISDISDIERSLSTQLCDLYTDSRQVAPGGVFIALAGTQVHGNVFIEKAIALGAVGVLSDQPIEAGLVQKYQSIFFWQINKLNQYLPQLASWFYSQPSTRLKLIGVTGTNGKTSTAFYSAQLLSQLTAQSVALMGTLGNGLVTFDAKEGSHSLAVDLTPSANTTSDVVTLNRWLAKFVRLGVNYVVMEVSSHALVLNRIAGLFFNTVALTQVTRDHLDFHGTEQAYRVAKEQLFTKYPAEYRVVNLDDGVGKAIADARADDKTLFGYSVKPQAQAQMNLTQLQFSLQGLSFCLQLGQQAFSVHSGLMGKFNAENLACAISICLVNGFSAAEIAKACKSVQAVAGRMEKIRQHPWVLVDYAHTPDALIQALQAVRQHMSTVETTGQSDQKLWVIFGCGGNRDSGKRPLMGRAAQTCADVVVLTDDNPRCEASYDILNDILQGFDKTHPVQPLLIPDRKMAIESTLAQANPQDIILIAGKGHETYQAFCDEQIYFSDQMTVRGWKK